MRQMEMCRGYGHGG